MMMMMMMMQNLWPCLIDIGFLPINIFVVNVHLFGIPSQQSAAQSLNAPRAFHSKRFNLEMNAGGVLFFQDSRTCVSRESWPYLGVRFSVCPSVCLKEIIY